MKVSEAIRLFLQSRKLPANADLVDKWHIGFETQINVAADNGEPVADTRSTYTDGIDKWWSLRIPKGANSEPSWKDYELTWPLDLHAEGIGLTGWNWQKRTSLWVGFDIDSLLSHAAGVGISEAELARTKEIATSLPYIEVRHSTGGKGLHLYCYLDNIPTNNHTEHAALARCVLGMMSSATGFDFARQIDCCGGIMWVWHRKLSRENQGLEIIKPASQVLKETDLPTNWRDHVEVITRKRAKIQVSTTPGSEDPFEALASSQVTIPLDANHKALLDELQQSGFSSIWVADYHLLQTHTKALEQLHAKLQLKGVFKTISEGHDPGTPNCFLFPLANGAWRVYRFSPGINEADTWEQDGSGWTNCYYNKPPDLATVAKLYGGLEAPNNGGYVFANAETGAKALSLLGQQISVPTNLEGRETRLKAQKDGRVVFSVSRQQDENAPLGWLSVGKQFTQVTNAKAEIKAQIANESYDECDKLIRALVSPEGKRAGWVARATEGDWIDQPKDDIKSALAYHGKTKPEIDTIVGSACVKPWRLISVPFQPEYPGGRHWNRRAIQYLHAPAETDAPYHPHWDMILNHCFGELTNTLNQLDWAKQANIKTGYDYGLAWMACLLREPLKPLPYLFLFGDENSGKSIFHESFAYLITARGLVSGNLALTNTNGFNGELAGAVLAYIEEIDIAHTPGALARIKEWVLSPTIPIRQMRTDLYSLPNTLHFVQIANEAMYCPVLPGDTRITMIYVPPLAEGTEVPRHKMGIALLAEAPHFMRTILDLTLPPIFGRLRLPVVGTASKTRAQEARRSLVEVFIMECCRTDDESHLVLKDFCDRFLEWLSPDERSAWNKRRINKELPAIYPIEPGAGNRTCVNNLAWRE